MKQGNYACDGKINVLKPDGNVSQNADQRPEQGG